MPDFFSTFSWLIRVCYQYCGNYMEQLVYTEQLGTFWWYYPWPFECTIFFYIFRVNSCLINSTENSRMGTPESLHMGTLLPKFPEEWIINFTAVPKKCAHNGQNPDFDIPWVIFKVRALKFDTVEPLLCCLTYMTGYTEFQYLMSLKKCFT